MNRLLLYFTLFLLFSCKGQAPTPNLESSQANKTAISKVEQYYLNNKQDSITGKAIGTVGNGSLKNGTLLPFTGANYLYFDTSSYLAGRTFTHPKVARTIQDTYEALEQITDRTWYLMELSNKHGGKLFPHRTHQNGLSVDFMSPLQKSGQPYYDLDNLGIAHYSLEFNNQGKYTKDDSISIDFDSIGLHILTLQKIAKSNGLTIEKVIFKMELKDELYASEYGKELRESGIYITKNLTPLINGLHDDHYHIDFKEL